jgi:hypothetical protein
MSLNRLVEQFLDQEDHAFLVVQLDVEPFQQLLLLHDGHPAFPGVARSRPQLLPQDVLFQPEIVSVDSLVRGLLQPRMYLNQGNTFHF